LADIHSRTNSSRRNTRCSTILWGPGEPCLEARISCIRRWWSFENGFGTCRWIWKIPHGIGSFELYPCMFRHTISSIFTDIPQNNIPNNYSFAMHAQNFGPWALRIPRVIFVTLGFIAAVIVGCCAARFFPEATLQTFLSIIGYWTVVHIVVVTEEHFIFRRGRWSLYDLDAWSKQDLLPFGWGAIGAFCFGFLGAALGMKITWYTGPIAELIGKKGANIGHELTFAFSALTFPLFRWLEKKYTGK
jgi:purine-cytosine permease-like protein